METTIDLGQADASAWLDQLESALAQRPGYEVSGQAGELRVSRSYISDNRLVGSVILGFLTAGIGFLLLARRDTESFTVAVVGGEASDSRTARVSGEWSADTESLIARQAPGESAVESTASDGNLKASPDPAASTLGEEATPPVPVVVRAPDLSDTQGDDATRRVPAPREAPPSFMMQLDDGQRWTLAAVNIVGRGPTAPVDSDGEVQLIQIDDATQSVSKNHARILVEDGGIRVIDLQSTNGTRILLPDGQRITVDAAEGAVIDPGAVIEIGERTCAISSAGDSFVS